MENIIIQQKSLTVSILVNLIKNSLENEFLNFWVQGEISNLTLSSSGHYYFNLKDSSSQIKCVIFKFTTKNLNLKLKEGQEVELTGKITLYSARGELQIIVDNISDLGFGKLYAKFELLKQKLQQEGYFSNDNKNQIPKFPEKIGIITSNYSAAIYDVLTTIKTRNPSIEIIIYPTSVQGVDSKQEIANAINVASNRGEVDVLILCRGGGSIEDLWSFNEEIVIKAIYNCNIPIVCGVGHESDFTLSDFVSDIRAATPTAAAQIVTPNKDDLLKIISLKENIISNKIQNIIFEAYQRLDHLNKYFFNTNSFISIKSNRLNEIDNKLDNLLQQKFDLANSRFTNLVNLFENNKLNINNYLKLINNIDFNLNNYFNNYLNLLKSKLVSLENLIEVLSPLKILDRGFSLVKNEKGDIIKNSKDLKNGDNILIQFSKGVSNAIIDNKK